MDLNWLLVANSFQMVLPYQCSAKKSANVQIARWKKCELKCVLKSALMAALRWWASVDDLECLRRLKRSVLQVMKAWRSAMVLRTESGLQSYDMLYNKYPSICLNMNSKYNLLSNTALTLFQVSMMTFCCCAVKNISFL